MTSFSALSAVSLGRMNRFSGLKSDDLYWQREFARMTTSIESNTKLSNVDDSNFKRLCCYSARKSCQDCNGFGMVDGSPCKCLSEP